MKPLHRRSHSNHVAYVIGRVVNADGEPWGEAELHSIVLPGGYPKVGKDGRFKIEGLIPGKPYTL